jgi:hypothetical protein
MISHREYLAAATMSLPRSVADPMEEAFAKGAYLIRAGRYADGDAVCPLGAADAQSEAAGSLQPEIWDTMTHDERYGGRLLRFAVSFDLCAERDGLETAVDVVKTTLARRRSVLSV